MATGGSGLGAGRPCGKIAAALAVAACMQAGAVEAWYSVANAPDRLWTTAAGWLCNTGALGRVPAETDNVTLNSNATGPDNPIVIPAGCEAFCNLLWIASISGAANNYAADGRIPALTVQGTLKTASADLNAVSVGRSTGGFGLMRLESGSLVTNTFLTVGHWGIGVVTNNGGSLFFDASAERNLTVGAAAGGVGSYVQEDGLFSGKMHVGMSGTGTVEIAGGTVTGGNEYLGIGATGVGRMQVRGGTVSDDIYVGWQGNGLLETSGGKYASKQISVGIYAGGEGLFRHRGGTITPSQVNLGWHAGAHGELDVEAETTLSVARTLYCGYEGRGTATLRSNVQQSWLKIGGTTNCVSEMAILSGATNKATSSVHVGGYPIPVEDGIAEMPGCGILTLRGGTLHVTASSSDVDFFIGRYADGWGCLRGYGKVAPSWARATNVRIGGGACVIRADGEGEDRDLDLNEVVNITNLFAEADVSASTNGWYAADKGRVLFPRSWFNAATDARCIGDYPYFEKPRFVNSVRCAFTGAQTGGSGTFLRGGLYARDRGDVPEGLASRGDVIGVWGLGLYDQVDTSTKRSFGSVSLTFRYDHTKVPAGRSLALYRHDGTEWRRVGTAEPNDEHLISTDSALAPLAGSQNIGFFAVVVPKAGLTVVFR